VTELAITALDVVCPVGLNAVHACAALRAGISRLAEHDGYFFLAPEGPAAEEAGGPEPLVAARVPVIAADLAGADRLSALALRALRGIVAEAELGRKDLERAALLLALPAADAGTAGWQLGAPFAKTLCQRAGLDGWALVQSVEGGATAVLQGLEAARVLLDSGRADRCVLLSADTLVSGDRLAQLDGAWRLRSPRNPDGLLPGEASAALVVEATRTAERRRARILGLLGRTGSAREPAAIGGDRWSTGTGLCGALRPLLEGRAGAVGRYVLCDLNGEAYRAQEWGIAQVRLSRQLAAAEVLVHPADAIGDVGCAMAAILIACACEAFTHGYAPAQAALIWAAADDGARAAVVVRPGGASA
jgi:3-oxoacyl-[acyl-carrier-protein] synthase-1